MWITILSFALNWRRNWGDSWKDPSQENSIFKWGKKIRAHGYDTEKQIQGRGRTCQSKQERTMLHFRSGGGWVVFHSFLLSKRNEAETMWIDERSLMWCGRHGDVLFWWLLFTSWNKKQEYQLQVGIRKRGGEGLKWLLRKQESKRIWENHRTPRQLKGLMSASWFIKSREISHHDEFSSSVFNWTSAGNKWERGECNQH